MNRQNDMLRALVDGPKSWKYLREAYFGPERAKNKSNTAFQDMSRKLLGKKLMVKTSTGYEITDAGRIQIGLPAHGVPCLHPLLSQFGRCAVCDKEVGYPKDIYVKEIL